LLQEGLTEQKYGILVLSTTQVCQCVPLQLDPVQDITGGEDCAIMQLQNNKNINAAALILNNRDI
jgi:hypothetical protein